MSFTPVVDRDGTINRSSRYYAILRQPCRLPVVGLSRDCAVDKIKVSYC